MLKILWLAYKPPSKDVLSGHCLAQETAFVNQAIIKELKNSQNLTLGKFICFIFIIKLNLNYNFY